MAQVYSDQLYGSQRQYDTLKQWLRQNKPEYLSVLHRVEGYTLRRRPIAKFSLEQDRWLYQNCPLKWVKTGIEAQYSKESLKKYQFETHD